MAFWKGGFTVTFISRYFYIPLGAQQLWTLGRAERRTEVARSGTSAQRWDMLCGSTKRAPRGAKSQDFANRGQWWPWAGCPGWHTMETSHCAPTRDLAVKMGWLNHLSTLSSTKRKGFLEMQSWGGPYYPATELHTLMSKLNLSTQVACTTSNQQHVPPSSS